MRASSSVGVVSSVLVAFCCALGVAPTAARAGGFGVTEMGTKRTAMEATVARPDDGSAVLHNPAALVNQHGMHLFVSAGFALIGTTFYLKPWGPDVDGQPQSNKYVGLPVDANGYYPATKPDRAYSAIPMAVFSYEVIPDKLVAALSLYVPNATGSSFGADKATRYHLISGYIIAPVLSLSAAYKVLPWLNVGASAGMMKVILSGKRYLYPILPDGRDISVIAGSKSELSLTGSAYAFTWNASLQANPLPWLTIGLNVIGKVQPKLTGDVKVVYGDDAPRPGGELDGTQKTTQFLPWTIFSGIAADAGKHVEIGVDFRYYFYKDYTESYTQIIGLEDVITELRTPKNYGDSWTLAAGVRVHDLAIAPGWEFMTGTHYDKTPAPATTVSLDQPTFTHYGLRGGVRYSFDRYKIAAAWAHYWYEIPTVNTGSQTAPPTNFKGNGDNNIWTLTFDVAL